MEPVSTEKLEKFDFDIHFQNGILKQMLQDEVFAFNCMKHVEPGYFDNKYQAWLFKKISQYVEKFKQTPSSHFLVDQLKTISKEEIDSYKKGLKNILETDMKDTQYMKDELTAFIRNREYKKLHKTCATLFNEGKFEQAYKMNEDLINEIRSTSFVDDSYVKGDEIDVILARAKDQIKSKNVIPTGVPQLDEVLFGGLLRGTASTIIGSYNDGKTTLAMNIAVHAAMAGKKVLILFHEGSRDSLVLKFLSRITSIPYHSLKTGFLDEADYKKIETAKLFIEKFIRIKEMKYVGVSVEDVFAYCKQTKKEWDFDLLIDDYAGILDAGGRGREEKRHLLGHIWKTLNLIAGELNIAILTLMQFNRDGVKNNMEGKKILRSINISECAEINHHSENIFTINRSVDDKKNKNWWLCLDKARDAETGLLIKCFDDFRIMRMFDPKTTKLDGFDDGQTKPKAVDKRAENFT